MKRMKENNFSSQPFFVLHYKVVQSTALEWESLGLQLWLGLNQTQV